MVLGTESGEQLLRAELDSAPARVLVKLELPKLSVEAAWKVFADTELLNRAIGSAELDVCNVPVRPGVSRRLMTTRTPQPVTYEEEHYQWEWGRWVGGRRFFNGVPLERFLFLFTHHPHPAGALAELRFGIWGRGAEGASLAQATAAQLQAGVEALAGGLRDAHRLKRPRLLVPKQHEARLNRVELRVLAAALVDSGEDPGIVAELVQHLEVASDLEVAHQAPLALAREWGRHPEAVVDAFIRAARLGMLIPEWSVACPSCLGPKGGTDDVAKLAARPVHCADCNLSFEADPTLNMQLTFAPAPRVRKVEVTVVCVGSPMRTPHIKAQAYLPAGSHLTLSHDAALADGLWLVCPDTGAALESLGSGRYRVGADGALARIGDATAKDALELLNETGERIRVRLEDRRLPDTFLRASQVLARPRFRELFGADQWEFLAAMERSWRASFGFRALGAPRPAAEEPLDLVVIGAGPGGEAAALRAAQLGKRVALVEASPVFGGPSGLASKAMREAVHQLLAWADTTAEGRDPARRHARLRALFEQRFSLLRRYVGSLQMQDVLQRLTRAGVRLHHGAASFADDGALELRPLNDGPPYRLRGRRVVIATGSRPARPSGIPFDGVHVLDAAGMGELERLPRTLCVIGAGVIGCEFAAIMGALGVKVTVLGGGRRPLPFLDGELARAGVAQLAQAGITILHDAQLAELRVVDGHAVSRLTDGSTLVTDVALYAEGREANTAGLGCERVGVKVEKYGRIAVDAEHRTANPSVFAIGDVVGPPGLASTAAEQGRQVSERMFGDVARYSGRGALYPTTIWTFPELAGVGLTEEQARKDGLDHVVGRAHYGAHPRGILCGDLHGWLKLVAERRSGKLLGVHIVGTDACELIHYGRAMIEGGVSLEELARSGFSAITFHGLYAAAAEDALIEDGWLNVDSPGDVERQPTTTEVPSAHG